jgi:hypothetical protein
MKEHYVTLFDSLFLPQGLALYNSMQKHIKEYTLWVLCVDKDTFEILSRIKLKNMKLLDLSQLETDELKEVKKNRNKAEYCWTLTPFALKFVFDADESIHRVTYLDADLWFRKNPKAIFGEFEKSGKHVLITDHNYAPEYDQSLTSGQYCVQFMTFTRPDGEVVRQWWEDRCIEWCFARYEDGKFGDQKYLDDWGIRFNKQVHILQNKELILAPWNATRFPFGNSILWHFQGLRIVKKGSDFYAYYGFYNLPQITRESVYGQYILDLKSAIELLDGVGFKVKQQEKITRRQRIKNIIYGLMMPFGFSYRLININTKKIK